MQAAHINPIFQFHLVRLKGEAVKSVVTLVDISIPFSTIKSVICECGRMFIIKFQFHLVRLKGSTDCPNQYVIRISIPFSTIKSFKKLVNPATFIRFQFHLVRLKGIAFFYPRCAELFQFHLVRLKDIGRKGRTGSKTISIPFSTIKRWRALCARR